MTATWAGVFTPLLLFLAGLEIDVARLRGPLGRVAGMAFAVSAVLGLGFGVLAYRFGFASILGAFTAGLLSAILFPPAAMRLLARASQPARTLPGTRCLLILQAGISGIASQNPESAGGSLPRR
jgi:NhaP-type Na+/H+ or K+/H+ antiporter